MKHLFFPPLVINNIPSPLQSTTSTFTQDTLAIGLCERHIPHRTPTVGGKKIRAPVAVLWNPSAFLFNWLLQPLIAEKGYMNAGPFLGDTQWLWWSSLLRDLKNLPQTELGFQMLPFNLPFPRGLALQSGHSVFSGFFPIFSHWYSP